MEFTQESRLAPGSLVFLLQSGNDGVGTPGILLALLGTSPPGSGPAPAALPAPLHVSQPLGGTATLARLGLTLGH